MVEAVVEAPLLRLKDPEISRLAREIARDIVPLDEILKRFGLMADDFDVVANNNFFSNALLKRYNFGTPATRLVLRSGSKPRPRPWWRTVSWRPTR